MLDRQKFFLPHIVSAFDQGTPKGTQVFPVQQVQGTPSQYV